MRRVLGWCAACALIALALGLTAAHVTPGPGSGAFVLAAAGEARRVAFLAPLLPDGPVAVNTADAEELDTLPGVGEVIARRIMEAVSYTHLDVYKRQASGRNPRQTTLSSWFFSWLSTKPSSMPPI